MKLFDKKTGLWYGSGLADPYGTYNLRIRILLLSSVTFKRPTKNFAHKVLLKVHVPQSSKIKSHKTVEIKVFLTFLLDDGRIRIWIRTNNDESGSGRPKTYRSGSTTLKKCCDTAPWNVSLPIYPKFKENCLWPMEFDRYILSWTWRMRTQLPRSPPANCCLGDSTFHRYDIALW